MKIFNMDNKFHQNTLKAMKCIYLSLLMLFSSLPLVTFGVSLSAGYYTYHKIFECEDERSLGVIYWRSFKENFRNSFLISTIAVGCLVLLYVNYQLAAKGLLGLKEFRFFFIGLAILLVVYLMIYFSLAARFENTFRRLLVSALSMAFLFLPNTLFITLFIVALYFLVTIIPITFLVFPILLIGGLHFLCEKVFYLFEQESQPKGGVTDANSAK